MFAKRTQWNLAPNRLSEALAAHRAAGKPLLDLTNSNPTECGFNYDSEEILRALGNPSALRYEPNPRGLVSARAAISKYYRARGEQVPIEDIFLTASTSEAYSYIFQTLCDPGDEILIPSPSYPLFDFLADIQDVRLVRYPLLYDHGWQIDFHSLEKAVTAKTRAVIVVHANNPTGQYAKEWERQRLNEICAQRELAIVADEVFLDFSLEGLRERSFVGNRMAATFTLSGLSKISGLPQMKLAWMVVSGPEEWRAEAAARIEVIADTFLSVNTPVQVATPRFLELATGFQSQVAARVKENLMELDRQLAGQQACSRLKVEGGWCAVLRVPATRTDEELAVQLLERRAVLVHPGHFYEFATDGYLVVSLIVNQEVFERGIKEILEAQKSQ